MTKAQKNSQPRSNSRKIAEQRVVAKVTPVVAPVRQRGRPRSGEADSAILSAAIEILTDVGYRRMTVGAVAKRAGVSEPTIYLRHGNKFDLAISAVEALPAMVQSVPDLGDTRAELRHILNAVLRSTTKNIGSTIAGSVLAEEREHPELLRAWRERIMSTYEKRVREIIDRGVARGEIRSDINFDVAVSLFVGTHFGYYMAKGSPQSGWTRIVTDLFWAYLREPNP